MNRPFLFVWIVLVSGFIAGCASIHLGPRIAPYEEKTISGSGDAKILLIDIEGMISNRKDRSLTGATVKTGMVDSISEMLLKARQDKNIKAILLRINSPGGTVTSSDIIYHQITTFKKETALPVYVSIVDLAASGGYYIALAADKIVAHPTALQGSIGVIAIKPNLEGLMAKLGVDWEVVKSADKKDFLSPFRSLTEEERRLFQNTIDFFHDRFVQLVAENRPELDLNAARELADGRVYNAGDALDLKLVDAVGYLDDVVLQATSDLRLSEAKVVTYHRPGEYRSNIYSSLSGPPSVHLLHIDLGLAPESGSPKFMYLWRP